MGISAGEIPQAKQPGCAGARFAEINRKPPSPALSRPPLPQGEDGYEGSNGFVFEVALALLGLGELIFAQNIFLDLHIDAAKVFEPGLDLFLTLQHFLVQIICIDIDADRSDYSKFLPHDWDRGAFEFSRADIELVI